MSVIDTSMDMPKYCWSSDGKRFLYCKRYETCPYKDKHFIDYVPPNCPLKSADEILSVIANHKLSDDELIDLDEDSILWGMKIAYDLVE